MTEKHSKSKSKPLNRKLATDVSQACIEKLKDEITHTLTLDNGLEFADLPPKKNHDKMRFPIKLQRRRSQNEEKDLQKNK
ncbi:MAG: hypothetical protein R3F25_07865 [Gammaproteobacteria bacterium]